MTGQDDSVSPTIRDANNYSDAAARKFIHQEAKLRTTIEDHAPDALKKHQEKKEKPPAGGYDPTPITSRPAGYTIKITFHGARNLPFADLIGLSSDPYLTAVLRTNLPKRHKQDPDPTLRTPTISKSLNPDWNTEWIVAHVPPTGFQLKVRLFDEDPADHDDRLGNVTILVTGLNEYWRGIRRQNFDVKKRMGSKRAYFIRGVAAMISKDVKINAELILSIECIGRSEGDGGRAYTVGPLPWIRHYSPLIGRITGTKDRGKEPDGKRKTQRYNFQAVQMQLPGPVPHDLYHRYVEFKPFIAGMFTAHTLRGRILNRALHHQHNRIYNFDRSTLYGHFNQTSLDLTKQFLDFAHYDDGGRIFTYVLTLDAKFRFTETGKEFGIDMLSKHTMHSDVSIYIACSGEFFIRRRKKPWQFKKHSSDTSNDEASSSKAPQALDVKRPSLFDTQPTQSSIQVHLQPEPASPRPSIASSTPSSQAPSHDPSHYELIIDNDSGTYRPAAKILPQLREFMSAALPGLKIKTLDCQADEEKMKRLKDEQRKQKRRSKGSQMYLQPHSLSDSSISSSDESDLDSLERRNREAGGQKVGRIQSVKRAISRVKDGAKGALEQSKTRTKEDERRDSSKAGGIVGQHGPVKQRERIQEAKQEKRDLKEKHKEIRRQEERHSGEVQRQKEQNSGEGQGQQGPDQGGDLDQRKDADQVGDEKGGNGGEVKVLANGKA